jgi:glycosyltransferase involved in cell wall biosynthesis
MRIAYVLTQDRGGPVDVAVALAKSLIDSGEHSVRLFGPPPARDAGALGACFTRVDVNRKGDLGGIRRMRAAVRTFAPDIVHAQDRRAGLAMAGLNRVKGGPSAVLQTYHGVPDDVSEPWFSGRYGAQPPSRYTRAVLAADGVVGRLAKRTIVPSSRMGDFLHARIRVPRSKLVQINNGVVLPAAAPTVGPIRRLLFVGMLIPRKGLTDLLHALSLPGVMPADARLDVAGDGPSRQEAEEMAQRAPLAGRIRFLGFRTDVADLMTCYDAIVLPSRMEQQPVAIAQAMAAGKPVLATRTGGVAEMVELPGLPNYLAAPGDIDDLARALTRLFDNPDPEVLSRKLVARAHQRYSIAACASAHIEVYTSLLSG